MILSIICSSIKHISYENVITLILNIFEDLWFCFLVNQRLRPLKPLEVLEKGEGKFKLFFREEKKFFSEGGVFLRAIFHGRVVLPSPKIVINLPSAYDKLHCKQNPNWFIQWLARSFRTNRQRSFYFILKITKKTFIGNLNFFFFFNELKMQIKISKPKFASYYLTPNYNTPKKR